MKRREDRRPDTKDPAPAGQGPFTSKARETSRQAIRGLFRLCLMILAAILGFLSVEAVRAIF
jgi:hypothetical protein